MNNESYLSKKKGTEVIKKSLIVPFSSDKGLCGGVNSAIIREVKTIIGEDRHAFKILSVGDKGTNGLNRPYPDLLINAITELHTPVNFTLASAIAH